MKNPEYFMTTNELDEQGWTYLGGVLDLGCEGGFGLVYCKAGIFAVFNERESEITFVRYLTRLDTLESLISLRASRLIT